MSAPEADLVVRDVIDKIRGGEIRRALVLCGAGLSVAAGIPDFRTPRTGLFAQMDKLWPGEEPTEILSWDRFRERPEDFFKVSALMPRASPAGSGAAGSGGGDSGNGVDGAAATAAGAGASGADDTDTAAADGSGPEEDDSDDDPGAGMPAPASNHMLAAASPAVTPTTGHMLLRLLADHDALQRVYTQNIDMLERAVGVPPKRIVEAHGSFATVQCTLCHKKLDISPTEGGAVAGPNRWVVDTIARGDVPFCREPQCVKRRTHFRAKYGAWVDNPSVRPSGMSMVKMGILKPGVVLYGESLPQRYKQLHRTDAALADLVIVMGTALEVFPVSGLIDMVAPTVPRLLINLNRVGPWASDYRELPPPPYHGMLLGTCDAGTTYLALACGWSERLRELQAMTASELAVPCKRAAADDEGVDGDDGGSGHRGSGAADGGGADAGGSDGGDAVDSEDAPLDPSDAWLWLMAQEVNEDAL